MTLFTPPSTLAVFYIVLHRLSASIHVVMLSNVFFGRWSTRDALTASPCRVVSSFRSSPIRVDLIQNKTSFQLKFTRIIAFAMVLHSATTGPGNFGTDTQVISALPELHERLVPELPFRKSVY